MFVLFVMPLLVIIDNTRDHVRRKRKGNHTDLPFFSVLDESPLLVQGEAFGFLYKRPDPFYGTALVGT